MTVVNEKEEIVSRYRQRLARELGLHEAAIAPKPAQKLEQKRYSSNYEHFKKENLPRKLSLYEKLCNLSTRIINVNAGKEREAKLQKLLYLSHINTTPNATVGFSV